MPNDAHDAVLNDFGSIDMLATRCTSYYICRGRQTFHPAAVLRKLSTSIHCLNHLACARSNDRPPGWTSPALHTTTPLHGYSRLPAVVSVTIETFHSISRAARPACSAPVRWRFDVSSIVRPICCDPGTGKPQLLCALGDRDRVCSRTHVQRH